MSDFISGEIKAMNIAITNISEQEVIKNQRLLNFADEYIKNSEKIFTNGYNAALEDFKNTLIDKMEIGPCVGEKFAKFDNFDIEDIAEKLKKEVKD